MTLYPNIIIKRNFLNYLHQSYTLSQLGSLFTLLLFRVDGWVDVLDEIKAISAQLRWSWNWGWAWQYINYLENFTKISAVLNMWKLSVFHVLKCSLVSIVWWCLVAITLPWFFLQELSCKISPTSYCIQAIKMRLLNRDLAQLLACATSSPIQNHTQDTGCHMGTDKKFMMITQHQDHFHTSCIWQNFPPKCIFWYEI